MDEFDRHREPEQVFLPISDEMYASFYDLEMGDYDEDIPFYLKHCQNAESILELGCGTGRITRQLQRAGRLLLAIDLSPAMLQRAQTQGVPGLCHFLCMDMRQPGIRHQFDCIIIGYNTLGLLAKLQDIRACLALLSCLLKADGVLLCQLYSPATHPPAGKALFQFSIHQDSRGNRLVKEVIRRDLPEKQILVEERYRWRPISDNTLSKGDWYSRYKIASLSRMEWLEIFTAAGFTSLASAEVGQEVPGSFLLAARQTQR